jgi:hypothetical protein
MGGRIDRCDPSQLMSVVYLAVKVCFQTAVSTEVAVEQFDRQHSRLSVGLFEADLCQTEAVC